MSAITAAAAITGGGGQRKRRETGEVVRGPLDVLYNIDIDIDSEINDAREVSNGQNDYNGSFSFSIDQEQGVDTVWSGLDLDSTTSVLVCRSVAVCPSVEVSKVSVKLKSLALIWLSLREWSKVLRCMRHGVYGACEMVRPASRWTNKRRRRRSGSAIYMNYLLYPFLQASIMHQILHKNIL